MSNVKFNKSTKTTRFFNKIKIEKNDDINDINRINPIKSTINIIKQAAMKQLNKKDKFRFQILLTLKNNQKGEFNHDKE